MWDERYFTELYQIKAAAQKGGGEERKNRQHSKGKLTARERMRLLFDGGVYHEMLELVESRSIDFGMDQKKVPGDGVVGGWGLVNGRLTFAVSQDFTVCGGAGGEEYALKISKVLEKAIDNRAPFVNLDDSGGARIEEGINSLSAYGRLLYLNTLASGMIPQIAAIMGPCAGGSSYSPALCDFILMTEKTGQMYITGPQVVKSVLGQTVTGDELGGTKMHMKKSGNVHLCFQNDKECIRGIRLLLSYLPQNNMERVPIRDYVEEDKSKMLQEIVPQNKRIGYDVIDVLKTVIDKDSFMEIQSGFAPNIVIGFARFEGKTVGIAANQPNCLGGALDYNASDKIARFVRFCDCFNVPFVTLVDVPAFMPGLEQEQNGIIRHGAKLLYAFSEATIPKVCLIMRKAYGGAFVAMNSKNLGADIVYAWPIAEIAVMGDNGAIDIIFRKKIREAENQEQERQNLAREYNEKFMNPYYAAKRGFVDEVIHPDDTRKKICEALKMLENKHVEKPWKKHGNIPL